MPQFDFIVAVITSVVITIIWVIFGLFKIDPVTSYVFFAIAIILPFYNAFTNPTSTDVSSATAYQELQDQIIDAQAMTGTVALVYVFLLFIPLPKDKKDQLYKIMTISLILLASAYIHFGLTNDPIAIRRYRIVKNRIVNHATILFIFGLYIIMTNISL